MTKLPLSRRALIGVTVGAAAAPATALSRPPRFPWPNGARAAVSLTYDDGLDSQLDHALPELDALGFRATFFLTGYNIQWRLKDWSAVAAAGHEVADHTMNHPCALGRYSAARFEREEIAPTERLLSSEAGESRPRLFAYPCGYIGLGAGSPRERRERYLDLLRETFAAARTTVGPPNDPYRVPADPYRLHAFEPTYESNDPRIAFRYLHQAMARGDWAILIFHEVLETPKGEGDTSIATHQRILEWIKSQPLWVAPMGEALDYIETNQPKRARRIVG
jgi:peptidoglycan/xylan/chitin deacetylase (PgdA/CDA1 family)